MCSGSDEYDGNNTRPCTLDLLTNCQSDYECMTEGCFYDGEICPTECSALIGNGKCDAECNLYRCNYDDCISCSYGCDINMLNNNVCDDYCMNSECYYDGGDCCPYSDCKDIDTCDYKCMSIECNYSNDKCVRYISVL